MKNDNIKRLISFKYIENTIDNLIQKINNKNNKGNFIKQPSTKTSIVILTYNNLEYSKLCIESIKKYTRRSTYEIIVVDNYSTDGTVEWLKQQNDIKLILNKENLGFPKGCNQGIEIAEKGNDVLLLNNDTIVTPNWLENLKTCLYSETNIGAVGSVTNNCSNYQTIPCKCENTEEIIKFGRTNNISNPSKWEERLRLIGFCMLIRNQVVQEVGLLEEMFTPGNFEDDDYSLRIRKAGYKLMLCKDSFIYHFGSISFKKESKEYTKLLARNREKFTKKWGIDLYKLSGIEKNSIDILKNKNDSYNKVLHINCGGGGTLLWLKSIYSDIDLFGIEESSKYLINTGHFADIKVGGIEKITEFNQENFDAIIYSAHDTELQEIHNIISVLKGNIYEILIITFNENIDLQNSEEYKKLKEKLAKHNIDIKLEENNIMLVKSMSENKSIKVSKLDDTHNIDFKIKKDRLSEKDLIKLIRRIENRIDVDLNLENLKEALLKERFNTEDIINLIKINIIEKGRVLNIIGALYYGIGVKDKSLKFLKEAYTLDYENSDIVYNLASILFEFGELDAVINIIEKLDYIDNDLDNLKEAALSNKN